MKELIYFILTLCSILNRRMADRTINFSSNPSINWEQTKEWRLYYTQSKDAFSLPFDSLKALKSISLNQDSVKTFLKDVIEIPTERAPVWMGYYVCSCKLSNGKSIKIEISQYGRFFFEEGEQHYYQLNRDVQDSWQYYLSAKWSQLEGPSK